MRLRLNFLCLLFISIFTYSSIQAQCFDEDLLEPDGICTLLYQPVCGCNGVTYSNPCVAEKFGGVTSYEAGPCPQQFYSEVNQDYINMGYIYVEGSSDGSVLSEERSLLTAISDQGSTELTLSQNFGSNATTSLKVNPFGITFQTPLVIAPGAPVDVGHLKKIGPEYQLRLTKDELQKSLRISPTSLSYSNASDGSKSFAINFENNSMDIGNLQIINLGNDNLGLDGDVVPITSAAAYDLGNNVAGEHWDDVVANNFVTFSDRRLKNNIKSSQYGLAEVMKLEAVQYIYNKSIDVSGAERLGFIAQDVKKIVPHVVHDSDLEVAEDGKSFKKVTREHLSMSYQDLIPVLTKAIQEQQSQIDLLSSKLDEVQRELEER